MSSEFGDLTLICRDEVMNYFVSTKVKSRRKIAKKRSDKK